MHNENNGTVLGIIGSPRRGGNTEILIDEVLKGAGEAGASTGKIALGELNIAPCRACDACKKTGRCVIEDDMVSLLEKMEQSDIWILGTPVYFWGPTAQFKAFIDRWHGAKHQITFKGRRIILVIPLENKNAKNAQHTVGILKNTLNSVNSELVSTIIAPGVYDSGAVNEHPAVLAEARSTGLTAVSKRKVQRAKNSTLCTPDKCK